MGDGAGSAQRLFGRDYQVLRHKAKMLSYYLDGRRHAKGFHAQHLALAAHLSVPAQGGGFLPLILLRDP